MHKTHGRLTPAPREEHSNVAGKTMVCVKCGKEKVITAAVFGETKCDWCGGVMTELGVEKAKLTGKS